MAGNCGWATSWRFGHHVSRGMPKGTNMSFDVSVMPLGRDDVSHEWGHIIWPGTTIRWVPVVWVVPERVAQRHWLD